MLPVVTVVKSIKSLYLCCKQHTDKPPEALDVSRAFLFFTAKPYVFMTDKGVPIFNGHLSDIPKAFQEHDVLKAGWLYERKRGGTGVSIDSGAKYPSVSQNFDGIHYPPNTKKRILTEVLHCNGQAGCSSSSCKSKRYAKCSAKVHIVHFLSHSEIWFKGEHGPNFKPGSYVQRGLSQEVRRGMLLF